MIFNLTDATIDYFKKKFDGSDEHKIERLLIELKEKGVTKAGAVYLLREEGKLPLTYANTLVLKSKAWDTISWI